MNYASVFVEQFGQPLLSQSTSRCLTGDFVPEVEKRLDSPASKPLIVRDGEHDSDVALLISEQDRRPLRLV